MRARRFERHSDRALVVQALVRHFYRRKIEEQEKYLPDLHDAAAARAVLEEAKAG